MSSIAGLQSAVAQLLTSANSGGFDYSFLVKSNASASIYSAGNSKLAIENAEKNEARQLAQTAKSPAVQRDLARYAKVVKSAKSVDEVLSDPIARKVFMKANGLGAYVDQAALAKKAITSDPTDEKSLAYRLSGTNAGWLDVAKTFNFPIFGTAELKTAASLKEISDNYIAEVRLDDLDAQLPGLGSAILFKDLAPKFDKTIKILGSALGREVVTTALGLPKQIALQSLEAQTKAIEQRLDIKKLQDPQFVDKLVQRYLINLNGGVGGVTA